MGLTLAQFALTTGASNSDAAKYHEFALEAMDRFHIAGPEQIAAFCATLGIESMHLTKMEEDLYYKDPERLAKIFRSRFDLDGDKVISPEEIAAAAPYCRNPKGLSMRLYNGFHGRGGIQLTWEKNYKLHGDRLGFDYVSKPDLLIQPQHAMLSAGSYWDLNDCNSVAGDMRAVTLKVNGPALMHLKERTALYKKALTHL
jgi:putative chitinase